MVDVVVGDDHGDDVEVTTADDLGHRREVVGGGRPGIDDRRAAGAADDVGVGAVEGHRRRVGCQHPGDLLVEHRDARQVPERWQVRARVGWWDELTEVGHGQSGVIATMDKEREQM
jgi:hypothetical protein